MAVVEESILGLNYGWLEETFHETDSKIHFLNAKEFKINTPTFGYQFVGFLQCCKGGILFQAAQPENDISGILLGKAVAALLYVNYRGNANHFITYIENWHDEICKIMLNYQKTIQDPDSIRQVFQDFYDGFLKYAETNKIDVSELKSFKNAFFSIAGTILTIYLEGHQFEKREIETKHKEFQDKFGEEDLQLS